MARCWPTLGCGEAVTGWGRCGARAEPRRLIPDGLRRWAQSNGTTLAGAYLRGAHKVIEILQTLQRHDVRTVTVYNLSRANLGRTPDELDAVYQASLTFLTTLIPTHFDATVCSLRLHGDRKALPDNYVAAAHDLEVAMTGDAFRINMLAAYDAYDELRDAHRRAQQDGCDIARRSRSATSTSSSAPPPSRC